MYKRENRQMSFYDEVYERAVPEGHFLRMLDQIVNWRSFKKYFSKHYKERGRNAHNPVMMFKLLILQFIYNLSDRQLEEAARDRISFRWFARIDPVGDPPDYSCFSRFRDRLGPETIKKLFQSVVDQAGVKGLVVDRLSIVDATDIKSKVDVFKNDPPRGSSGPDPDACWGKKSDNKPFHGYKAHMAMDDGSEIITLVEASTGEVNDGHFFDAVHDPNASVVTADKGYDSQSNFDEVRSAGQVPAIIVKRKKGKQRGHVSSRYFEDELPYYYRYRKRRPRIEHKFGEGKKYHGLGQCRYWSLAKVRMQIFLTAIALNLKRMIKLEYGVCLWQTV